MKLAQLNEWIDSDGKDEKLRDDIVVLIMALLKATDVKEIQNLLDHLEQLIKAIPVEEPKSQWQIDAKQDVLNELDAARRNTDRATLFYLTRSVSGILVSLNIVNKQ